MATEDSPTDNLGREIRAGPSQTHERLSPRDDRHPEPRTGILEEEIRVLDSSAPPGGQGDLQGSVGWRDSTRGAEEMGREQNDLESIPSHSLFFFDSTAAEPPCGWELFGLYTRDVVQVIGEEAGDSRPFIPSRACFNCGADHTLKDCPQPRNPDVVRLAQDLFYFYNGKAPSRLHDVQAWEVERLQWVDTFEPGKIKGMRLREAMGHNDGDWLRNISRFGYPKGWTGDVDPRQKMRARILGEDTDSEDEVFYIFGMEEEERLDFERAKPIVETSDSSSAPESGPRRWATYPNTYFASDLLPIYKPPVKDALNTDVEYDMHLWRQELWDQILMTPLPPGKVMTLEAYYQSYFYHVFLYSQHFRPPEPKPPPPPTAEPPPLPPLPDTPPSILPLIEDNLSDDDDMDLSD